MLIFKHKWDDPKPSALDNYDFNKPHGQQYPKGMQWTPEMEKEHNAIWDKLVNGGGREINPNLQPLLHIIQTGGKYR